MAEAPRLKGNPNQNLVAAMAAAVAANLRLATPAKPQNQPQKVENPSYPTTSVGDVGNPDIRNQSTARP